jgi:hypothetical protein
MFWRSPYGSLLLSNELEWGSWVRLLLNKNSFAVNHPSDDTKSYWVGLEKTFGYLPLAVGKNVFKYC